MITKAKKKLLAFSCDSAGHNLEIFKYCNHHQICYFVSLAKNEVVLREAQGIPKKRFKKLPGSLDTYFAESTHCMYKNKNDHATMRTLI